MYAQELLEGCKHLRSSKIEDFKEKMVHIYYETMNCTDRDRSCIHSNPDCKAKETKVRNAI